MQHHHRYGLRLIVGVVLAGGLAGCAGGMVDNFSGLRVLPRDGIFSSTTLSYQNRAASDDRSRPITSADLVGPEGQCALSEEVAGSKAQADIRPGAASAPQAPAAAAPTAAPANDAAPPAQPAFPPAPGSIVLRMTECDVVSRAGPIQQMDVGANERGDRTLTLTYMTGPWPGAYHFTGGRLAAIDRVIEPPKPKPVKRTPKPKKPA